MIDYNNLLIIIQLQIYNKIKKNYLKHLLTPKSTPLSLDGLQDGLGLFLLMWD